MNAGGPFTTLGIALLPTVGAFGSFLWFIAVGPVIAVGSGITQPSISSLLSRAVETDEAGGMLGLGQSCSALGRVLGPSVAGELFEIGRTLPFWAGSALMATCIAVALAMSPPEAAE